MISVKCVSLNNEPCLMKLSFINLDIKKWLVINFQNFVSETTQAAIVMTLRKDILIYHVTCYTLCVLNSLRIIFK